MGHGARIAIDSLNVSPCIIVRVDTDTLMSISSLERFRNWIKTRLQADNVEIENTAIN